MPSNQTLNVLVRMPNWLGDCVMALPALRHLSEALPNSRIFLAGRHGFEKLLTGQPGVAGFVEAPASGFGKLLKSMHDTQRIIRQAGMPGSVDLGLLFTNSLSTAAWLWRTGARCRVGYDLDCRRFFLSHPVPCGGMEQSWHFIHYYLWLAKFAESVIAESEETPLRQVDPLAEYIVPSLALPETLRDEARAFLATKGVRGAYAVIAPASAYGPVKDWPPEHYRMLVAHLNKHFSLPVVVTGGGGQADVCETIARDQEAAVNVAGRTSLELFAAMLAGADLFVGGDSGGAHVAAALGIPTLVIFGITNPTRTKPTGTRVRMLGQGEATDVKLSTPAAREAARKALAAIVPEMVIEAARAAMTMETAP